MFSRRSVRFRTPSAAMVVAISALVVVLGDAGSAASRVTTTASPGTLASGKTEAGVWGSRWLCRWGRPTRGRKRPVVRVSSRLGTQGALRDFATDSRVSGKRRDPVGHTGESLRLSDRRQARR